MRAVDSSGHRVIPWEIFGAGLVAACLGERMVEVGRVRVASISALEIEFALRVGCSVAYVAFEGVQTCDLTYLGAARPGEYTRILVGVHDKPVRVYIFFPPAYVVGEEVEGYFA